MDGTFDSFEVESDSFQADSVQDVDAGTLVEASGFACNDENGDGTYEAVSEPTLRPNNIFTLCVVPKSTSFQCKSILDLKFEQDVEGESEAYEEVRIGALAVNPLLTGLPSVKTVDYESSPHIWCVVDARLGAKFFESTSPKPVTVSGSVLFDFKAASGRRLDEATHPTAVFGERNLQQSGQPEGKFDVQFQLEADETPNNKPQVDAGASVGGYCSAAALAAVAVSQMI